MHIRLNGAPTQVPDPLTVSALVRRVLGGAEAAGLAVALNGDVVRRLEWEGRQVVDGDEVEILKPFAGG